MDSVVEGRDGIEGGLGGLDHFILFRGGPIDGIHVGPEFQPERSLLFAMWVEITKGGLTGFG